MSCGTWYCKEDVLRDLGGRVEDIDDGFFAIGERPPPPPAYVDDDSEMQLLFGNAAKVANLNKASNDTTSDFKGITKMIRMVEHYEDTFEEKKKPEDTLKSKKNDIVLISKLNPNVSEFVPRTAIISPTQNTKIQDKGIVPSAVISSPAQKPIKQDNELVSRGVISTPTQNTKKQDKTTSKDTITVTGNLKTSNCSINFMNSQNSLDNKIEKSVKTISKVQSLDNKQTEFQKVADLLKNQISSAAKEDTFEKTKEKNTAIAKLLKLYSRPAPKSLATSKPKLYTPQFFEQCKATDYKKVDEIDVSNRNQQNSKPVDKLTTLGDQPNTSDGLKKSENCKINLITPQNIDEENSHDVPNIDDNMETCSIVENSNQTTLTQEMVNSNLNECDPILENPSEAQLEESISKVNNWLDPKPVKNKEMPKSPSLYLSTVAFKRKDPATCKSPHSEIVDKKISKPSNGVYQPTKYAEELVKKYEEQVNRKAQQNMNVFDKLYHDLKERDLKIKERSKTRNNENENNA